mmetsp:Transcript_6885/g.18605  ORF Transcript_6885/g.18605 Transcript_6885/m.18605 type:complete len:214 (-) Transcript_6885:758-1399(-)
MTFSNRTMSRPCEKLTVCLAHRALQSVVHCGSSPWKPPILANVSISFSLRSLSPSASHASKIFMITVPLDMVTSGIFSFTSSVACFAFGFTVFPLALGGATVCPLGATVCPLAFAGSTFGAGILPATAGPWPASLGGTRPAALAGPPFAPTFGGTTPPTPGLATAGFSTAFGPWRLAAAGFSTAFGAACPFGATGTFPLPACPLPPFSCPAGG